MKRMGCATNGVRRGLTLIEVLVAVAILGIVSAAVISSFGGFVALNREAQTDNDLVSAARAEIEDLRQWASPAGTFDGLTRAAVDARLGDGSACATSADLGPFAPGVLRVDLACDVDGASSPAEFSFLIVRR